MKTKIYFVILTVVVSLGFSACNIKNDSNYTPEILLFNPAKLNSDSTILMKYGADGNIVIDSLHINDTILVMVGANGYINNLLKLSFKVDNPSKIEILEPHDSIKSHFDPSSDFKNGSILMQDRIVMAYYPFEFVTKEKSEKVKIDFLIESDAKEVSNSSGITLAFPIK